MTQKIDRIDWIWLVSTNFSEDLIMRFTFVLGAALISMSGGAFAGTIDLTAQSLNEDAVVAGTDVILTPAS